MIDLLHDLYFPEDSGFIVGILKNMGVNLFQCIGSIWVITGKNLVNFREASFSQTMFLFILNIMHIFIIINANIKVNDFINY
jgi:hypothetical protein